jgi:maltose O-acetyltransferase
VSDGTPVPETTSPGRPLRKRVAALYRLELAQLRPRLLLLGLCARLLPRNTCNDLRVQLLRAMGFAIGKGTRVQGLPELTGESRLGPNLVLGEGCTIEWGCVFELGERLTIGDRVSFGPEVMVLTTSHELGPREHRAGPRFRKPVVVANGASVGARSIILPGVTIGEGAEVLAGSVVNKDVAPHTRVGGLPAKVLGPAGGALPGNK